MAASLVLRPRDFDKFISKTAEIDVGECIGELDRLTALVRHGFISDEVQYLEMFCKLAEYCGWNLDKEFLLSATPKGKLRHKYFPHASWDTTCAFVYHKGKYRWASHETSHHNGDYYDQRSGELDKLEDLEARAFIWSDSEERLTQIALERAEKDLMDELRRRFVKERVLGCVI